MTSLKGLRTFLGSMSLLREQLLNYRFINISFIESKMPRKTLYQHITFRPFQVSSIHSHEKTVTDTRKDSPQIPNPDPALSTAKISVASEVKSNIVYEDDHIIAVNKPPGLSVYGPSEDARNISETENAERRRAGGSGTIIDSLDTLRQDFNCKQLDIGLSLKSKYSGIMLLTKSPKAKKTLQKVISKAISQKEPYLSYLLVTVGEPLCDDREKQQLANICQEYIHDRMMSVVKEKSVTSHRKHGRMIQTCFQIQVLGSDPRTKAALVEMNISKDKWECVESLMSHLLSPVLGDVLYSSRVQTLMGVPFVVPAHSATPGSQRLPPYMKQAFTAQYDPTWQPPLCIHRQRLTLSKFPFPSSQPLVIEAPPPQHFLSVMSCLELYKESLISNSN